MTTEVPRWLRKWLTPDDLAAIVASVAAAEARTSAEIRVHLEPRVPRARFRRRMAPLLRAQQLFARLGMHRTRDRNGVLVYVALVDRTLALLGDEGIHARVGDAYWAGVRDAMVERFAREAPREAVVHAVTAVGEALARHFPRRPEDQDELPNAVSLE